MAIVSSASRVVSATDVEVLFDAFPNSAGATASGADVAFKAPGGDYGPAQPARVLPADPVLGLPPNSVSCGGNFNPGGLGGALTIRCQVMWSDNSTDQLEIPVTIVVAPPNGAHLEYNVSSPSLKVGERSSITVTLVNSQGNGVANVQVSFSLKPSSSATGNLSTLLGVTDSSGVLSTEFEATAITGSGNKGQAQIEAAAGSGAANEPHRLIVIHVKP